VLNDDMWEMPIQCEGIDCKDHVLTTYANGSFNNKATISESAYLSAAKVVHDDKKQRIKRQHSKTLNDAMDSESESSCESKISHSKSLLREQAVHSNKKRKIQRQHSNVPNGSTYSESGISCNSRVNESTSLSHATKTIGHSTKKQKAKRKQFNVVPSRKIDLSANEEHENLTKNSRNNTKKSYFATGNEVPQGFKFDAF